MLHRRCDHAALFQKVSIMSDTIPIQDLAAAEIRLALEEAGQQRLEAVEEFIDRIGGLENARLAIQMLSRIERAA